MDNLTVLLFLILGIKIVDSFPPRPSNSRFELGGIIKCTSTQPWNYSIQFLEWDTSYWTNDATDDFTLMGEYKGTGETDTEVHYYAQVHAYTQDPFDETSSYILAYNVTFDCPPNSGSIFFENGSDQAMRHGEEMLFDLNKMQAQKTYSCRSRRCVAALYENVKD